MKRVIIISFIIFFLAGCGNSGNYGNTDNNVYREPVKDNPPRQLKTLTISFVGDLMVHEEQLKSAYKPGGQAYDFSGTFDQVADFLKVADFTVGNLETTISGSDQKYTSYPQFNTPGSFLDELKKAGFDVLTTANNHSMDRRKIGVLRTIKALNDRGFKHTGTFATAEDRETPLIMEHEGIRVALLAYTYGTNGIYVPENERYLVNLLDLNRVTRDVENARRANADVIIAAVHFGNEYERQPNRWQRIYTQKILDAGVDVIIGSHPHVLQPFAWVEPNDVIRPKRFVAYSLGNFISGQRGRFKDSGVILNLKISKDEKGAVIEKVSYVPTWVHRYWNKRKITYRVVAVEKAIRDYKSGRDKTLTAIDFRRLQQVWNDTTGLLTGSSGPVEIQRVRH
ncbi:MAG: CapA family protein [Bacillota bacterium]